MDIKMSVSIFFKFATPQIIPLWGQCAGIFGSLGTCAPGSYCLLMNQWYSQCVLSLGPTTRITTSFSSTTSFEKDQTTSSSKTPSSSSNLFSDCLFKFGRRFDWNQPEKMNVYNGHDYVYQWLGAIKDERNQGKCNPETSNAANLKCTDFNKYDTGKMLEYASKANKPVFFYTYIIPYEARNKNGITDCNTGHSNTLCTHGTKFIKENYNSILERYDHNSREIANYLGNNSNSVFMIEPDFVQYYIQAHEYEGQKQVSGLFDGNYMRKFFDDIVSNIKKNLPNARISFDVKAWIGKNKFTKWWSFFKTAKIDFVHTSGGDSVASTVEIKKENSLGNDNLEWKYVNELTGKKIIADCGIGAGGQNVNNRDQWLNFNNVKARANDGVVAVNIDYKCWENNESTCMNAIKPTFNVKTC